MALYKRETDARLRERDATIRALINANPEPMFIMDEETNILVVNDAVSTRLAGSVPPSGRVRFEDLAAAGIVSPRTTGEIRDHFYDTRPFGFEEEQGGKWISCTLTPLVNGRGKVDRCAVFCHDVTAIKRAEETQKALTRRLEKEKKDLLLFEAMMNSMDDFIIGTDDMGMVSFVNEAFVNRFGYTIPEVMNRHISTLQDPSDKFAIDQNAFFVDKKRVWNGTFTAVNKFGLKIRTLLKSSPVIQDGQTVSRVFVLREKL